MLEVSECALNESRYSVLPIFKLCRSCLPCYLIAFLTPTAFRLRQRHPHTRQRSMAPHPADWLAVDDLAILNGLSERARFLYHDVCDCDECVRLKDAARKLDDVTCWTNDDAAKAVVKAQQAVWEARKKLHKLHTADRSSVKKCGEHLPGLPRERMYIRSECEWDHELDRDDVVSEEVSEAERAPT